MSLMGTLAKVAIGYAAARGIDRMSSGQGIGNLFGGAKIAPGEAQADQAPGMGNMQDMMSQMSGGAGLGGLQDMIAKMASGTGMGDMKEMFAKVAQQSGIDMSAFTGGGAGGQESKGGLLSDAAAAGGTGAGMAGILAALGGAAAVTGKGTGAMIDQFNTSETAPQAEEAAALMLRAIIQAAKADGDIDADERTRIMETLGDDADADDIAFVKAQLEAPVDVEGLAAATPEAQKMQVYSVSLMSIRVDTQPEAQYLDSLARALGLNQQTVNALHLQMGMAPLYG